MFWRKWDFKKGGICPSVNKLTHQRRNWAGSAAFFFVSCLLVVVFPFIWFCNKLRLNNLFTCCCLSIIICHTPMISLILIVKVHIAFAITSAVEGFYPKNCSLDHLTSCFSSEKFSTESIQPSKHFYFYLQDSWIT